MKPETCYWNEKERKLEGNVGAKVREYLRLKLIVPVDHNLFEIDPTPGRHQRHTVDSFLWTCTCQRYNTSGDECSHILTVRLFLQQVQDKTRDYYEGKQRREQEENDKKKEKTIQGLGY